MDDRYLKHIILKEIGGDGQRKLAASSVLIVGVGGLGCSAAIHLVASGVGTIGIIDDDAIDITNLHRQILFDQNDVGRLKVEVAQKKLRAINSKIKINAYNKRFDESSSRDLIIDYDFIIDASDNFKTKFLINDACVREKKPFSHAGVTCAKGQTLTHIPGTTCYRCLFPKTETTAQSCIRTGTLGPLPGLLGTIQAVEAIKFITNAGEMLTNRFLKIDLLKMEFRIIEVEKNSFCPICGD